MNIVLKMSAADITRLVENFQAWAQPSANPYIQFLAKPQGCVITVYTSGKVMFQGEQAETYAAKFGYQETSSVPVQQTNIIGTDEVGNGSYFGGLAVVATYLSEADLPLIKKLGVDDSKN
jgi:ribonuclease HIII